MFRETATAEESLTTLVLAGTIILVVLIAFIVLLYFLFTVKKNKLFQEKQLLETQFQQALLQTQIEIQEQTLKTISQEIHDNIGQVLSLAKLNLNTFEEIENDINQSKIIQTKQLVSKAINDLRDLSRSLHGDRIKELGLQESVQNELTILQNTGQFKTRLNIKGEPYKLEPQNEMVLFRIVQEAIHNAVKHSGAKDIAVDMLYSEQSFKLSVADNGTGFDAVSLEAAGSGIGLKSMKNRATLIGARFSIESAPSNGTSVFIELTNTTT